PPLSTLFPYTTLFRSLIIESTTFRLCCRLTSICLLIGLFIISTEFFFSKPIFCDLSKDMVDKDLHGTYHIVRWYYLEDTPEARQDRKSTRLNSSHVST